MNATAIQVEKIGKQYRIGEGGGAKYRYKSLRDVLANPFRRRPRMEMIWALKDVSFTIQQGEVVGIIGRNGAGKSTLLKILSQITEPTEGHAEIRGRVASLLEVGTGFHPELTGRENIFLNGTILGMRKTELARKFDEIVAFSEVEKFIDTPVKHYSSGMQMRLAFSVAAHLEPEILLVDEVLAVGDAEFQKKCLGKMSEVTQAGRTVLFVSHNMGAIRALCAHTLLLKDGRLAHYGRTDDVVSTYLSVQTDASDTGSIPADAARIGNGEARFQSVQLKGDGGQPVTEVLFGLPLQVEATFELFQDVTDAVLEIGVVTVDGTHVVQAMSIDGGCPPHRLAKGWHTVTAKLTTTLLPRQYSFLLGIHHTRDGATMDFVERSLDFTVLPVTADGKEYFRWTVRGFVRAQSEWQVQPATTASRTER